MRASGTYAVVYLLSRGLQTTARTGRDGARELCLVLVERAGATVVETGAADLVLDPSS